MIDRLETYAKNMKAFFLLLTLCLFTTQPIYAAQPNTYEAKVPVSDQSESAKREAIHKALSEILIKNSGNAKILSNKDIQEILSKAHDYIQSYKYFNEKKRGGLQKFIQVTFDKEDVDRIIQRASALSATSVTTPAPETKSNTKAEPKTETETSKPALPMKPTLIWLSVKASTQDKPELIEYEQGHTIGKLLELTAKKKNIPILIPELDVENITLATADNIWKLDKSHIMEASSRYTNANILAGRLSQQENNPWKGQWLFKNNAEWIEFNTTGETPEANLSQILDSIQPKVGSATTTETADEEQAAFLIQVHQVNDLDKSAKLLQYVRQLPVIKQVDTVNIQSDSVILEIQAKGGKPAFQEAIELDKKLIPTTVIELDSAPEPHDSSHSKKKIDLQYDWQEPLLPIDVEH